MMTFLSVAGFLLLLGLLVLWGFAFWKRPQLAGGAVIGVVCGAVVMLVFRTLSFEEMPIWLPALPFAVIAITLFGFGFLAWYWGRED